MRIRFVWMRRWFVFALIKLDFLAQEMNREANTTLSKINDVTLADVAIDMKTEIEKIREQVQNIE